MIDFYYHYPAPNPAKVALFLEEAGLPYKLIPVDLQKGEQFSPQFLALNPNGKVPVIVDGEGAVFDSNAILLYLAEKTGKFLSEPKLRGELLSWLMFVATGVGPYTGQAAHFKRDAPDIPYARNRYVFESKRHFSILDARLAERRFMIGDGYTIVDMEVWGWAGVGPYVLGKEAWAAFPNVQRLADEVNARPAAIRANALKNAHVFKEDFDEEARRILFRHTVTGAEGVALQRPGVFR